MSIVQAALGTTLIVPTVEGDEEVEVKAGTQPGTEIRLRGRGVPHLRRNGVRGDLHVMVDVAVPTRLSKKERELLEAYADEAGEAVASGGGFIDKVLGKKSKGRRLEGVVEAVVTAFWLEISVEADTEAVEAVSEILGRVAPAGTSVEPGFELVDEGLGARVDPARSAIVRAYVEASDPEAVERTIEEVTQALGHLQVFDLRPIGEVATRLIDEADWAEEWKRHFPVLRVGRRLVIRPTWRRHAAAPGDVVLALDPGMAFGTGLHPTTRLCLAALESLADRGGVEGRTVLDVGCGSGILAIAAVRLGARRRSASTPIRSRSRRRPRTRAATGLPGGSARARAVCRPGEGPFDVVLANLIASLLVRLAPDLRAELAPGGTLLASGIFIDREAEVRDAFERAGLRITSRLAEGDWIALEAVHAG